jgi:hypothetical protein
MGCLYCEKKSKQKSDKTDNNSHFTSTLNEKQFNATSSKQTFKRNDDIICQTQSNQKDRRVNTLTSVPYTDRGKLIEDSKVRGAKYPKREKIFNIKMDSGNNGKGDDSENLIQEVELFLSMNDIKKISNYSIKVWICNNKKIKQYDYLGQTEEISEDNIDFGTTFSFNYYFEKEQILRLNILEDNNELIEKDITVGTIMGSVNAILSKKIEVDDIYYGNIQLELKKKEKNLLENQISNFKLKFELNDINSGEYFILLKRKTNLNKWRACYKSNEFFLQNGTLLQFTIDTQLLCDSEKDFLLMELYDSNDTIFKGCTQFTLENVNKNSRTQLYDAINSPKQIGYVTIYYIQSLKKTFIDYIKGGTTINLDIAIDYTASNEDPNNPISLHYFLGDQPNDYEKAIYSCGTIVGYYDRDQIFPVYGFGGIPKGQNKVSHCFNINFEESPDIYLIDNVLKVYKNSLNNVKLSGPTYFAPVITKIMDEIKKNLEEKPYENHYEILMILTDGIINDMKETTKLLVECASLPLSVIIIGIGDADFSNMVTLDGDEEPLTDFDGNVTKRDLVQFVEYEKFKKGGYSNNNSEELSEEVLKEIPRQIEEYYTFFGKFYDSN